MREASETPLYHPAARAAFGIRAALIIDIALLVAAHLGATAPGMKAGAERLPVPPGEKLQQEFLHRIPRDKRVDQLDALWLPRAAMARV